MRGRLSGRDRHVLLIILSHYEMGNADGRTIDLGRTPFLAAFKVREVVWVRGTILVIVRIQVACHDRIW